MKKTVLYLIFGFFLFSCEGDRGPTGPQGEQGLPGITTHLLTGVISHEDYIESYCVLTDDRIGEHDFIQVFLSEDPSQYRWYNSINLSVTGSSVYLYDPWENLFGYHYEIRIVKIT